MLKNDTILQYIKTKNYDLRVSHNGRWIDQKVTPDVLSLVAQTVLDYTDDVKSCFTNKDLYQSQDLLDTVAQFFGKPARSSGEMENEYNKLVGQQLKTLSYAGLLEENVSHRPYKYSIIRKDILELLAQSEKKTLFFLQEYIKKCLSDSGFNYIESFLLKENKSQADFELVRDKFVEFEIKNTSINKELEPKRILAKVLNPLALSHNCKGASRGKLSSRNIILSDLRYSRDNSQDANKRKDVSRKEYRALENDYTLSYKIEKAIRAVKKYNIKFNNSFSETGSFEYATQGHHILPKVNDYYVQFATYCENIIMLSPNEHYLKAHNNNKTSTINFDYQKELLLFKEKIILDAQKNHPDESPYDYEQFIEIVSEYSRVEKTDMNILLH